MCCRRRCIRMEKTDLNGPGSKRDPRRWRPPHVQGGVQPLRHRGRGPGEVAELGISEGTSKSNYGRRAQLREGREKLKTK